MKKVASTGAVLAGAAAKTSRVIQFAIAYYLLLSSGEALAQLFEGKGAGLEVHVAVWSNRLCIYVHGFHGSSLGEETDC